MLKITIKDDGTTITRTRGTLEQQVTDFRALNKLVRSQAFKMKCAAAECAVFAAVPPSASPTVLQEYPRRKQQEQAEKARVK